MKYTLLELTQDVLSSMDSDEINSITDTVESMQVVKIIKTVYDDILSRSDLVYNKLLFTLDASGDNNKPILMTKPTTIDRIHSVEYNKVIDGDTDPVWCTIQYLPVNDFMHYTSQLLPSETNVETCTHTSNGFAFTLHYRNDIGPSYFTSFDDNTLVFDAYDSEVDTTLQSVKTRCYGTRVTTFTEADSFTPELQPQHFALLLSEAKALAWTELKQTAHPKAEQASRRNWRHVQKNRNQSPDNLMFNNGIHPFNKLPSFGRK